MPREGSKSSHERRHRSRSRSPRAKREKRERDYDRDRKRHGRSRSSSSEDERRQSRGKDSSKSREQDKKKQKEIMKALETPEEKRARRWAKKEAKERKKREKMGWDKDYEDYTNADNPFGDQHLLEKFVWHKKREQDASSYKLSKKDIELREKQRQTETRRELEKVKKRRLEREKERELREEEMSLLQRMKEAEMFQEWESQEDTFHLEQARLRSQVRIETGRAKPIDLLAKYINTTVDNMDIEVQEPYHLLMGLNVVDLEDLLEDIKVYCEVERDTHTDFWNDMTEVCQDELAKLRRLEDTTSGGGGAERRGGVNSAVSSDVTAIFKGKTHGQLMALEDQINQKISGADAGTDVGYWETLLQQLKAHMARARLRDRHQAMLRKKLHQLKQEQMISSDGPALFPSAEGDEGGEEEVEEEEEEEVEEEEGGEAAMETSVSVKAEGSGEGGEGGEGGDGKELGEPSGTAREEPDTLIDEEDLLQKAYDDYEAGAYSPKLLKTSDIPDFPILDPSEDASMREANRVRVLSGDKVVDEYSKIELVRTMGNDGEAEEEYNFNSEVAIVSQDPIWKEKYRPRKPRFFNRVHTGFEWNKYNQTHYDTDNPPPKIVQGYKFNIFYPDLIDKRKTPEYSLTPEKGSKDFALLRFHAGPPYEDIAFRVVNREWEYSWKHGFRSQFNNNILQLWFRFKRDRYRR